MKCEHRDVWRYSSLVVIFWTLQWYSGYVLKKDSCLLEIHTENICWMSDMMSEICFRLIEEVEMGRERDEKFGLELVSIEKGDE